LARAASRLAAEIVVRNRSSLSASLNTTAKGPGFDMRGLMSYCRCSSAVGSADAGCRDDRWASDSRSGGNQNHSSSPILSGMKMNTFTNEDTFDPSRYQL